MSTFDPNREPGFYWVKPTFDVDSDAHSWVNREQPAYWDGVEWQMLGVEEWRPIWVGDRIESPFKSPTRNRK